MKKIEFKNGTLISKAKVTVNNTVYEVEPAEYEGETPLSASVLIEMQDNIEEAIEEKQANIDDVENTLTEKIVGTVLYEDEEGTLGDITLNDSAENYDYIEIYYKTNNRSGSIKVSDFNDKNLILPIIIASTTAMVVLTKEITILGSTITKKSECQFLRHYTEGSTYTETDSIYIYKVVGYKY